MPRPPHTLHIQARPRTPERPNGIAQRLRSHIPRFLYMPIGRIECECIQNTHSAIHGSSLCRHSRLEKAVVNAPPWTSHGPVSNNHAVRPRARMPSTARRVDSIRPLHLDSFRIGILRLSIRQLSASDGRGAWLSCMDTAALHARARGRFQASRTTRLRSGWWATRSSSPPTATPRDVIQRESGWPTAGSLATTLLQCDPLPNRYHLRSWINQRRSDAGVDRCGPS